MEGKSIHHCLRATLLIVLLTFAGLIMRAWFITGQQRGCWLLKEVCVYALFKTYFNLPHQDCQGSAALVIFSKESVWMCFLLSTQSDSLIAYVSKTPGADANEKKHYIYIHTPRNLFLLFLNISQISDLSRHSFGTGNVYILYLSKMRSRYHGVAVLVTNDFDPILTCPAFPSQSCVLIVPVMLSAVTGASPIDRAVLWEACCSCRWVSIEQQ